MSFIAAGDIVLGAIPADQRDLQTEINEVASLQLVGMAGGGGSKAPLVVLRSLLHVHVGSIYQLRWAVCDGTIRRLHQLC